MIAFKFPHHFIVNLQITDLLGMHPLVSQFFLGLSIALPKIQ